MISGVPPIFKWGNDFEHLLLDFNFIFSYLGNPFYKVGEYFRTPNFPHNSYFSYNYFIVNKHFSHTNFLYYNNSIIVSMISLYNALLFFALLICSPVNPSDPLHLYTGLCAFKEYGIKL